MKAHQHIGKLVNKKAQQGSSLVIAVFLMVVVLLFATNLMNMFSSSGEAIAHEVLGTRALAAANSGVQAQLQILFPLDGAAGSCPASTDYDFSALSGLITCTATVTCTNYVTHNSVDYYRLISTGFCGGGTMSSDSTNIVLTSRRVVVEAKELN